ncbi:MAG: hypothetical protein WBI14_06750 [Anaerolineaceae bacterium]
MKPYQAQKASEIIMVKRGKFLTLVQTALGQHEYQFVRQACLIWLANYPGDLLVSFVYASVLAELGDIPMALTNLQKVTRFDPEFTEAMSLLVQLESGSTAKEEHKACLIYLQRDNQPSTTSVQWLAPLNTARIGFESGDLPSAEKHVLLALAHNPSVALPALFHMQIVHQMGNMTLLDTLAGIYANRWPDCVQIKIFSAIANLQLADDSEGVEKLHWSASHDVSGQVINRILGPNHPYKPLWPEELKVYLDLPVPASVAAELGWNVLATSGKSPESVYTGAKDQQQTQAISTASQLTSDDLVGAISVAGSLPDFMNGETGRVDQPLPGVDYSEIPTSSFFLSDLSTPVPDSTIPVEKLLRNDEDKLAVTALIEIQAEFDKVAKSLRKTELVTADGRFPKYVLLTSRINLEAKYGSNTANVIIDAMGDLSLKITALPSWNSTVFVPDDPKNVTEFGLTPITSPDAWQLKLALADLDKKLATKGEMIGALLIVGGHDIVPFHMLPNPTDDSDVNVPSDNPYATTDENYFIAQWPVGRIPDEKGTEATFLLEQLRFLNNEYDLKVNAKTLISGSIFESWLFLLADRFSQPFNRLQTSDNLGYCAEVWKIPSQEVFNVIERAKTIKTSPPNDLTTLLQKQRPDPKFAYFNLHGLNDSPEWYGQRDFKMQSRDPEYPVALAPSLFSEKSGAPDIVLSEACYGAFILQKRATEAMSLNFLANGTRAFIGSTCVAYGSVNKPLIAADLLAYNFWKHVQQGVSVGYALMRAKMAIAQSMTESQGYLDGEDQKTILSFVLYGDPLASKDALKRYSKPMIRPGKNPAMKTISDSREELVVSSDQMPDEIIEKVRKVISDYLPGLDDATVTLNPQLTNFNLNSAKMHTRKTTKNGATESQRYVITLKKSYMLDSINHDSFARVTFDQKGDLIKLSASR